MRSPAAIAVCLATLLALSPSVGSAEKFKPPPGCKKNWRELAALEASLKGERKVPYDRNTQQLKDCTLVRPTPSLEVRRLAVPSVAVVVFDVKGSGVTVGQVLVAGKGTPWGETAQHAVSRMVFEPLVEEGIGITRVGVTMAFVYAPAGACRAVPTPPRVDLEIRVCSER
jgi:hypothetical protein